MIRNQTIKSVIDFDDTIIPADKVMAMLEMYAEDLKTEASNLGLGEIKVSITEKVTEPEGLHFPELFNDKYTPKKAYSGNVAVEDSDFFTDGSMAILKSKVTTTKKTKILSTVDKYRSGNVEDKSIRHIWNEATQHTAWSLNFSERVEGTGIPVLMACFTTDGYKPATKDKKAEGIKVYLGVEKLLFILDCVKPDSMEALGEMKPVTFLRDGEAVAILMPLRPPQK
jgi:hypothetical protein